VIESSDLRLTKMPFNNEAGHMPALGQLQIGSLGVKSPMTGLDRGVSVGEAGPRCASPRG
jgi:hypothetical protein